MKTPLLKSIKNIKQMKLPFNGLSTRGFKTSSCKLKTHLLFNFCLQLVPVLSRLFAGCWILGLYPCGYCFKTMHDNKADNRQFTSAVHSKENNSFLWLSKCDPSLLILLDSTYTISTSMETSYHHFSQPQSEQQPVGSPETPAASTECSQPWQAWSPLWSSTRYIDIVQGSPVQASWGANPVSTPRTLQAVSDFKTLLLLLLTHIYLIQVYIWL